jgi:hypothetical protein
MVDRRANICVQPIKGRKNPSSLKLGLAVLDWVYSVYASNVPAGQPTNKPLLTTVVGEDLIERGI